MHLPQHHQFQCIFFSLCYKYFNEYAWLVVGINQAARVCPVFVVAKPVKLLLIEGNALALSSKMVQLGVQITQIVIFAAELTRTSVKAISLRLLCESSTI